MSLITVVNPIEESKNQNDAPKDIIFGK